MAVEARRAEQREPEREGRNRVGTVIISWLTTTDHKKIGNLYMVTSFVFFLFAGLLA
ncbi:cytochrome ubiquinol oxidase subunit I, partial [Streptomyces sp. MCAF7]